MSSNVEMLTARVPQDLLKELAMARRFHITIDPSTFFFEEGVNAP